MPELERPQRTSAEFAASVGAQAARKARARRHAGRGVWFGLGMMGMIGWSVAIPTLLGAALGGWIDRAHPVRVRHWRCSSAGCRSGAGMPGVGSRTSRQPLRRIPMTPTDAIRLAAVFSAGTGLGAFFFGGLWLTVRWALFAQFWRFGSPAACSPVSA